MDPFRDELAAAHAKIAQLEEENRQLKGDHYPPPVMDSGPLIAKQLQRNAMFWTVIVIAALILGSAFIGMIFFIDRSSPPPSSSIAPAAGAGSTSP